jgi:hypothetical protein
MTFEETVAVWLRANGYPCDVVTSVRGLGTDWAGGTDRGFHDDFSVRIDYRNDGQDRLELIGGEEMQSLWEHVVGKWPA